MMLQTNEFGMNIGLASGSSEARFAVGSQDESEATTLF